MSKTAYVAFGGNIGDTKKSIEEAVEALDNVPGISVEAVSGMFETKPWGYEEQNNFVNACARLAVDITPQTLLGVCLGIESAMGRLRTIKNGPRVIDIDVIMYENEKIDTRELVLPHPRMWERDFVLVPLFEVSKDGLKSEIAEKLKNLKDHYVI